MLEVIQQNPVIALLLAVVPVVGVAWVALHKLYVEPRDYRISTLEKQVADLRSELMRKRDEPISATLASASANHHSQASGSLAEKQVPLPNAPQEDPLTSLRALYREWRDSGKTELQVKHFEEAYTGKAVSWEVVIDSIKKSKYAVTVFADSQQALRSQSRMCAEFPLSKEAELLTYQQGEHVRIEGVICDFFLWPKLADCTLRRLSSS